MTIYANSRANSLPVALAFAAAVSACGAASAATVTVNCAKGQTIAAALAANSPANGGLTLLVSGTCTEDVNIDRFSGVRIQGSPSATLKPVKATDTVVTANSRLILQNVAIAGGATGVAVGPHAYVTIANSEITGPGIGVNVWDNSSLDLNDATIATTGSYGIQSGLGSTIAVHADSGDVTEITGAQIGILCNSGNLNLTTAGSGKILIQKNKRRGVTDQGCGLFTYNPSGTISLSANGTASDGAGVELHGGTAILNSVEILNTVGFAAINAALNAGLQLNNVTMTGNVAGIVASQGAVVQFVSFNGASTVKNNGTNVFSCYQGGQIDVNAIAGTITPAPSKAQLGCLHVGGP